MVSKNLTPFDELDILRTVAQTITEATDEDQLINQATKLIGDNLFSDNYGILLVDEKNGSLQVHPSYQMNGNKTEKPFFDPLEKSIVGHVARTGLPERIPDVSAFPNYHNFDPETRSKLVVPLNLGQRTIGVINVESKAPNDFTVSAERLLVILASQISMTIARLRTVKIEKRRAEELAVLLELSQNLSQLLDTETVLDEIFDGVSRLLDTSNFFVAILETDNNHISFPININESVRDYDILKVITPTKGLTGHILQTRKPILIKNNPQDWEKKNGVEGGGELPMSWLGVPLLVGSKIIGVMAIQDYKRPNVYDENDLEIMTTIANQAAVAIENARLFEDTQRQLIDQTILRETTEMLSFTLDHGKILNQLIKQLCIAINATSAYFSEVDEKQGAYTTIAEYKSPYICEREKESDLGNTYPLTPEQNGGNSSFDNSKLAQKYPQGIHTVDHIDDPTITKAQFDVMEQFGTKSMLVVPLIARGQLIGISELLESRQKREFTDEEINLCYLLSQQAASAIENARLFEETQRHLQEQTILRESTEILNSTLDYEAILQVLTKQICKAINATSAYINEFDEEWQFVTVTTEYFSAEASEREKRSDLGKTYDCTKYPNYDPFLDRLKQGLHDEYRIDLPEITQIFTDEMLEFGVKSVLYIPLTSKGQLIGYSEIWESRHSREFAEEEIALCKLLSQQAATALENARVFDLLKHHASHDELTGVYNRRRLLELANAEFNRCNRYERSFSLLMLDIDNFKKFNDSYGHAIGDEVLKVVANFCQESLRESDFVGRYGGEEFVIILTETPREEAIIVSERLRQNIAKSKVSTVKGDLKVTVSIGLAEKNEFTPNLETLIARADQAMYLAKHKGRNRTALGA